MGELRRMKMSPLGSTSQIGRLWMKRHARFLRLCFTFAVAQALWNDLPAQETPSDSSGDAQASPADQLAAAEPPPLKEYMGRRIAPTMHYSGADWLTRDR